MAGAAVRRRATRGLAFALATTISALTIPDGAARASPWVAPHHAVELAPASERPSDPARAEALLAQADEARTDERWADAARLFTDAYDALTPALLPELGEMAVRFAVESHRRVAGETGDDAPLRAARDLVGRFEAELQDLPQPRPLPDAVAQMRDDLDAELKRGTAPSPSTLQPPPPEPPPRRAPPDAPSPTVSWVLVGVGGAAIVGGVATLVWGSRILPIAQRRLAERGPDPDPARDEAYLDENRRRGRLTMGFGGAIAVIGIPLLVWGIVRLTAKRHRTPAAAALRARALRWADPSGRGWASR